MCFRILAAQRIQLRSLASTRYSNHQSQALFKAFAHSPPPSRRVSRCEYNTARKYRLQQSGLSFYAAVVFVGTATGAALLFHLIASTTAEKDLARKEPSPTFGSSGFVNSYLVMALNMPPGRPGTLTPEQETKLCELWAVSMKVFGVYEPPLSSEVNGSKTPSTPATVENTEKDDKKEKKKSRLHVFKWKEKGEKGHGSESAPPGTATPSDISTLLMADEDDKHGQTREFKAAIANTSPEDLRKAFWSMVKHDHPDGLLLRFLRARKWDVEKALVMMISTMHWRAEEMHVDDDIVRQGELAALEQSKSDDPKRKKEGGDFLAQLRMGKSFLHGLDKEGRPMCIVRARLHKQGEQSEESIERFTVYTIETARMLLRPPVDTATIVFDMTNFSMANMDYAPVKFMIKCFEANYPESLGTVLVYKAPWIFNTIWSIIRGWLDPVVAGKVHFCKNVEELEGFVPRSRIPVELGGDEKWEYNYVEPKDGDDALLKDEETRESLQGERSEIVKQYESTVLSWIHSPDAKTIEERRKERDTIAEELRSNYWKLDPYVRARTLYDRIGILGESDKASIYDENKESTPPTTASPQATVRAQETSLDDLD